MIRTLQDALSCKHLRVERTRTINLELGLRLTCKHPYNRSDFAITYTSSDVCRICKHHELGAE